MPVIPATREGGGGGGGGGWGGGGGVRLFLIMLQTFSVIEALQFLLFVSASWVV